MAVEVLRLARARVPVMASMRRTIGRIGAIGTIGTIGSRWRVASPDTGENASARAVNRHHVVVRIMHRVNVVALTIMVASGLRIFNA